MNEMISSLTAANDEVAIADLHKRLREANVKYLTPSYVDMHGIPKTKMVPIEHLERMMHGSELFTGAALDGVPQDVSDEEVSAHPDLNSCMILPWRRNVAWFASDLWCEGRPFAPCNRGILKRVLHKANEAGYTVNCGIEAEFFVLQDLPGGGYDSVTTRSDLDKPAYDVVRLYDNLDSWLSEMVEGMNELGWDVYSFDHEDGIGQFEIDFNYANALAMADRYVLLRMMAHEIARKHGYFASFMPKPFSDKAGSGAHFNVSLADRDGKRNLFATDDDSRGCGLSELGYYFIGGIIKHLPAINAVAAPTVNSYKRLIMKGSTSGYTWAPCFVSYGNNNRTNTVRIPLNGGRVELRAADSACNPYLGIAMMVAAGLEGIRNQIDPGEPHRENLYYKSDDDRARLGVSWLPRTLQEAIDAFAADPLSEEVFGEEMFKYWIDFKRGEWLSYLNHVSDWETNRYLKLF